MAKTSDEIYREGLKALRDRLGRAGMVRFLQQFETGKGDYAQERHEWVDRMTFQHIVGLMSPRKTKRKRRSR
jgi:hypothetical protein